MSEINIPRGERDALKAIDIGVLDKLVEQCFYDEQVGALRVLRLEVCGPYVASKFRGYEKALADHRKAKAAKKRAETEYSARRAGSDLADAIQQMQYRAATEEKEEQFFYVDDRIMPPHRFSDRIDVRISYQWRKTIEDEWVYGSITFSHNVDLRPDYMAPLPNRKPSVTKQEQERQEKLYREWDDLKGLGLYAVKKYFKAGHDGAKIPQTFQAIPDSYTRGLNNLSTQFWPVPS
ncbi:hypothetical protein [Serratia fonticola]|uniref:Uncharacterized protein n=1 Tax=Serratia fonticola TaxID=47917 RepID=A0AAW3WJ27_SERFO|nr:hypothetical protein [Serratia fonticola]ALX95973.1 hypothetical protein AV650_21600 [Serratia fonticola]MBC3210691.1 hypothetical protein [Serratia fonticola]NYA11673.1 hypothetical protein [Serratia fonticola]NYA32765.1 hypothetical protein [Serratia fonticola]